MTKYRKAKNKCFRAGPGTRGGASVPIGCGFLAYTSRCGRRWRLNFKSIMQLPRITDQRGSVYPGSFLSLSPARVTALNVSGCHGDDAELRSRSARPRHTGVRNHGPCPQVETGQALERGGARNRNAVLS